MEIVRSDYLDTISARDALKTVADDLRKFAEFEYKEKNKIGHEKAAAHRLRTLQFAADYIEANL